MARKFQTPTGCCGTLELKHKSPSKGAPGLSFPFMRRADRHGDYGEVHTMRSTTITYLVNARFYSPQPPRLCCGLNRDARGSIKWTHGEALETWREH